MGFAISDSQRHWPQNRIPFVINDDDFLVGTQDRLLVEQAIGTWNRTGVGLIPTSMSPAAK